MGKKSKRPSRQQKKPTLGWAARTNRALETLDDDTAKPAPPLSADDIHAKEYDERHGGPIQTMEYIMALKASWQSLSEGDMRTYQAAASQTRARRCAPGCASYPPRRYRMYRSVP